MNKHNFEHLESIYRNYDIRGLYPNEITEDEVEKIGYAIVKNFGTKKVAVGYDIRPSSLPLKNALIKGLTEAGCNVVDLGLVTTPMTYYVCGSTDVDATVMVTASHMPSEYNGLKIAVDDSKPVTKDMLQDLKRIVGEHTYSSFEVFVIYDEFDHTTPNHEANPIKPETLKDLGLEVLKNQADIGIAFDGDADRVGFVDEKGSFVPADIIGALIAGVLLEKHPNSTIVYDTRSSKAVGEEIQRHGGIPIEWKVGHTNIRTKMREVDAIFGIELAGHYFFKETYFSEGGPLPAFLILELLHKTGKSLSTLVKEVQKYYHSTEINSEVTKTPEEIYTLLQAEFPGGEVSMLDGIKVTFSDWWFNTRPSANDPVLRLNLEANTKDLMEEKLAQVLKIIRS